MKRLLLFTFILLGFIAKSQEYDEIYIRDQIVLADSSGVAIATDGDTLSTNPFVRDEIHDSLEVLTFLRLTDTESSYTPYEFQIANAGGTALESPSGLTYNDSLNVSGNIIGDTIKASGRIGIGTTNPLSALHINKGFGATTGIGFGADGNTGFHERVTDELNVRVNGTERWRFRTVDFNSSLTSGASLIRAASTAFLPVHTFVGDDDLGLGRFGTDAGSLTAGGKEIARFSENVTEQFIINPQADYTGTAAAPNSAYGDGDTGDYEVSDDVLNKTVAGTITMKHTEDTTFVYNYLKAEGGTNISGGGGSGTGYLAINPSAYRNTVAGGTTTSIGAIIVSSGPRAFIAPVNLPHGSVVTNVIVRSSESDITWTLIRNTNGGVGTSTMATANTNTADSTISDATIDNQNYSYGITTGNMDTSDELYEATITYTF